MRITLSKLAGLLIIAAGIALYAPSGLAHPPDDPFDDTIFAPIRPGGFKVRLETVATGLTAPNWGIAAPGHPNRLFVVDQPGTLWAVNLDTGAKTVFLDVSTRLVSLGFLGPGTFDERGFLGVAFHPNYATNGLLYTYTSEPINGPADFSTMPMGTTANHQSVLLEWQVPDPTNPTSVVEPDSARELLRIDEPQFNHDGGALNFGPDGMLYVSLGDGGGADDQGLGHGATGNAQNPGNVLGSVLRIDPLGSNSTNGEYGIPADNPFVGQNDFAEEIFAYGFRNPFRFSFDMASGDLYLGDVGQNDIEEVNIVVAGGNYGWNLKEGTLFFDPNEDEPGFATTEDPGDLPSNLIDPIAQYDTHHEGHSVIGGFIYRGSRIPQLRGRYVFAEFSRIFNFPSGPNDFGRVLYLSREPLGGGLHRIFEFKHDFRLGPEDPDPPYRQTLAILGMGQDAGGELYVLGNINGVPFGSDGVVLRIVPLKP